MVAPKGSLREKPVRVAERLPVWIDGRTEAVDWLEFVRAWEVDGALLPGPTRARGLEFDETVLRAADCFMPMYREEEGWLYFIRGGRVTWACEPQSSAPTGGAARRLRRRSDLRVRVSRPGRVPEARGRHRLGD